MMPNMCVCVGDSAAKLRHKECSSKLQATLGNVFFVLIFQSARAHEKSSCLSIVTELKRVGNFGVRKRLRKCEEAKFWCEEAFVMQ